MFIPAYARSLKNTLLYGYRTITLLLGTFGLLFGIGFIIGSTSQDRYYPFTVLVPAEYWGVVFCVYGLLKLYQTRYYCSTKLRVATSTLGIWLWSYASISFILYEYSTLSPSDILLLLPLTYEILELVIDLFQHRNSKDSMRTAI